MWLLSSKSYTCSQRTYIIKGPGHVDSIVLYRYITMAFVSNSQNQKNSDLIFKLANMIANGKQI